jgi:uncharacterized protein (DUF58 family)
MAWMVLLVVIALADGLIATRARLTVAREFPERLVVGRWHTARLIVNHTGGSGAWMRLHDTWPAEFEGDPRSDGFVLAPENSVVVELPLRATTHGRYTFGSVFVRQWSGLALWERRSELAADFALRVFPEFSPGRSALDRLRELGDVGLRRSRQRGEGTDFESLRAYQQGDDSARIDWKATARRGKVVCRQYTIEKDHDVLIALDCGRLMGARFDGTPKLDYAMRAALALAEAGLRLGDRVGLMAFDSKVRAFLPPGQGPGQMAMILERVCELQTRNEETAFEHALTYLDAHHRKRSLVVLITDFVDRHTAAPMMQGLMALSRRHAFLFVAVEDPTIEQVLAREPEHRRELAGQAVAYSLRRERAVVLEQLRRQGISVLDLMPDRLTAPVLNEYLSLRNRGVL